MAARYGKWPHEVLDLDPVEMALASACVEAADAACSHRVKQIQAAGGMAFPVVNVGM